MKSFKDVLVVALTFLLLFTFSFPAEAACGGSSGVRVRVRIFGRYRQRVTFRVRATQCAVPAAVVYPVPQVQPVYPVPPAPAKTLPAPQTPVSLNTQAALAVMLTGTTVVASDSYGFTEWLNTTRATYGLAAVTHDANLAGWASANSARGFGHNIMNCRRQNAGYGAYSTVLQMWMSSAPHRAALLDPTIRTIGIAAVGPVWTFNAD